MKSDWRCEGDVLFALEEAFYSKTFTKFANNIKMVDKGLSDALKRQQETITDFSSLSEGISNLIQENGKDAVLLIDEIDKSSNSKVFLQFLGISQ